MNYRFALPLASVLGILVAYGCSSSSGGGGTSGGGSDSGITNSSGNSCSCDVENNGVSATLACDGTSKCVNGTTYTCGASAALTPGGACDTTSGDDAGQGGDDAGQGGGDDAGQGGDDAGSGGDDGGQAGDDSGSGDNDGGQAGDDAGSSACGEVSCQSNADCQTVSAGMVCLQLNSTTTSYACFFASPIDNCADTGSVPTEVECGGSTQYACVPGACTDTSQLPALNQQETGNDECGE